MEDFKDLLSALNSIKDNQIPWLAFTLASIICIIATFIIQYRKIKELGLVACLKQLLVFLCLTEAASFILLWAFGAQSLLLSVTMSIILAVFIENKYFPFLATVESSKVEASHRTELKTLEAKFKKTPNFSILEVLLYYGYIGELHKESAEVSHIFEDPADIAATFKDTPILTDEQLKEATAIMNVIRREGKILTREEALLIVSRLQDKGGNENEKNIS